MIPCRKHKPENYPWGQGSMDLGWLIPFLLRPRRNSGGIKMSLVCISSVNNGGDFIAVMVK